MDKVFSRIAANNSGETKCIIFVDSQEKARKSLNKYVNTIVGSYPFISAFGAMVNLHRIEEISNLDFVSAVSAHTTVHTCMNDVCQRLDTQINLDCTGYGEGVTAAIIDTGIFPHLDFMMPKARIVAFEDFVGGGNSSSGSKNACLQGQFCHTVSESITNRKGLIPRTLARDALRRDTRVQGSAPGFTGYYDDNGHGTAVAGILGGNGLVSGGKFGGIAHRCNLISLKAIGGGGEGGAFAILEAMQWIFNNRKKYNIKVVCMSFGSEPLEKNDPLSMGAEVLWNAGITVVASAGNSGPNKNTVRSPGINPSIITVGGAGFKSGVAYIPDFSSRGPAGEFVKPDIVADGVGITTCATDAFYGAFTGTSMSAPVVAGVCACLLSQNPKLSPQKIKELLISNAKPVSNDINTGGHGVINIDFLKKEYDFIGEKD